MHRFGNYSNLAHMKMTDLQAIACCKATSQNLCDFMTANKISTRELSRKTGLSQNTIKQFRQDSSRSQLKTFWKLGAGLEEHPGLLLIIPLGHIARLQAVHEDLCPIGFYYHNSCPHNNGK